MSLIPTLTLFEVELTRAGAGEEEKRRFSDAAVQQLGLFSQAGGQILFGTDVGYIDAVDTTEEYRQMGRAQGPHREGYGCGPRRARWRPGDGRDGLCESTYDDSRRPADLRCAQYAVLVIIVGRKVRRDSRGC